MRRRRPQPLRMSGFRLRPWLRRLHLWLGLAVALPFIATAATGVIITWAQELAPVLDGPQWQVNTDRAALSWTELLSAVREHHPQGRITFMGEDRLGPRPLRVYIDHPARGFQDFLLDARTGQLQPRDQSREWSKTLIQLHRNLLLGAPGRRIIAWSSLAALALSGIGLILWWPMRRGSFAALRGRRMPLLRWHNLLGVLAFAMLLMFVLTGVTRTYNASILATLHTLAGTQAPVQSIPDEATGRAAIAEIVAAARAAVPDGEITRYSESSTAAVAEFRLRRPGGLHPAGSVEVRVDAARAEVLDVRQPAAASWAGWYEQWWYLLHTGGFLDAAPRALWALASLALAALGLTGAWHWLRRRLAKRRRPTPRRSMN